MIGNQSKHIKEVVIFLFFFPCRAPLQPTQFYPPPPMQHAISVPTNALRMASAIGPYTGTMLAAFQVNGVCATASMENYEQEKTEVFKDIRRQAKTKAKGKKEASDTDDGETDVASFPPTKVGILLQLHRVGIYDTPTLLTKSLRA